MKKLNLFFSIISFLLIFNFNLHAKANEVQVFKSASCSCCSSWASYMKEQGYNVKINTIKDSEVIAIKKQHGVPESMYSCHTALVNGLVVEGHVPANVIEKALKDPSVNKIAVPNMPAGSPGMGGANVNGYNVYSINKDGNASVFYKVTN